MPRAGSAGGIPGPVVLAREATAGLPEAAAGAGAGPDAAAALGIAASAGDASAGGDPPVCADARWTAPPNGAAGRAADSAPGGSGSAGDTGRATAVEAPGSEASDATPGLGTGRSAALARGWPACEASAASVGARRGTSGTASTGGGSSIQSGSRSGGTRPGGRASSATATPSTQTWTTVTPASGPHLRHRCGHGVRRRRGLPSVPGLPPAGAGSVGCTTARASIALTRAQRTPGHAAPAARPPAPWRSAVRRAAGAR